MLSMEEARERDREWERNREIYQEPLRELGMQQKHRQHIMNNMEKLIRNTDYNVIVAETVRRGLISPVMRRNIEDQYMMGVNLTDEQILQDRHKKYFEKITKRGPTAYAELKAILRCLKYVDALRILEEIDPQDNDFLSLSHAHSIKSNDIVDTRVSEPRDVGPSVSGTPSLHNDDVPLTPFEGPVNSQRRQVTKSTCIHTDKVLGTYTMKSKNRGVLFIVNIIDFLDRNMKREGADVDSDSLIHIFREMGFTTFYYKNLSGKQFFSTLEKLTSSHYVRDTECFVMVVMTHGDRINEVDKVMFHDSSAENVRSIINHFESKKCPNLLHKPKVLMFPFCRGETPDHGHYESSSINSRSLRKAIETDGKLSVDINSKPIGNVATLSDVLVCYASVPGFETHRETDEGSWYIQKLCDTMAAHAHDTSMEDMLKKTQSLVGNLRTRFGDLQTGSFDNLGFNKKLFFNPGFFAD